MSIDTRILGSTVAELVGVDKQYQMLALDIVTALNKRNNPTNVLVEALADALRPHEKTAKALGKRFGEITGLRLEQSLFPAEVFNGATKGEEGDLTRLTWQDCEKISNFHPLDSWCDKCGYERHDHDLLNPTRAVALLERFCKDEISLLDSRCGIVPIDTRLGVFIFEISKASGLPGLKLDWHNWQIEKTRYLHFSNVRIFALKKQKR